MAQVRSSKYRHVYGEPTRKDKCYDNIRLTKNAFDSNLVKTNGKYLSLNWDASGGGSFAVIPVAENSKLPDRFPLFDGHKGPVLDTDWNPFDDEMVVSASDDGTIGVWRVPEGFSVHEEYGTLDDCKDVTPVKFLEGHGKKVGHVGFNPVARNILASTSLDNTVKVWNVESGDVLFTLQHPAFVGSFSWNYDGTKLVTVAKDKKIRIWDVRSEKVLSEGKGHAGAKGSRAVWLGDNDRVLTTGFSLFSDREMALWDTTDIAKGPIGGFRGLDPSSGIVIPHYDPMTSIVYLGGRGDGKIVYFEYADDTLYDLFAFNSTSPQRGLGWAPLRSLLPKDHEVARVYKVHDTMIEPIPFRVPLKNEGFLDNVYTYADAGEPSLSAEEWKAGKTARPLVKDWKSLYEGKDPKAREAPIVAKEQAAAPSKETSSEAGSKSTDKGEPKKDEKKADSKEDAKKDAKPEPTADSQADTKPKAESQNKSKAEPKAEPKNDVKKDLKETTNSPKAAEIAALKKAEKQDSYDVLQSDEVKSFLAKNSEEDEIEEKKVDTEESTWDEEPVKETSTKAEPKKAEPKEAEPKEAEPKEAEPKKAEPKEAEPKKAEPKKAEPKKAEPKKAEPKKAEPKKEELNKDASSKGSAKDISEASESMLSAAKASSEASEAAQKASIAAKASSESLSKAASASPSTPEPPCPTSAKLEDIIKKLDAFNVKIDNLSKRLEAIEKKSS